MVLAVPGDFVHCGRALLSIFPPQAADAKTCSEYFSIGRKRSGLQDLRYAIDELVELAARALSPGVNDPFTAIACIDWLGAAIEDLAVRPLPPTLINDAQARPRLLVPRTEFRDFLSSAVGQLRPYVVRDRNAAEHLLQVLGLVTRSMKNTDQRELIEEEMRLIVLEMTRLGVQTLNNNE